MKERLRNLRSAIARNKLKNKGFTLIANNCLAGCVCHDLNQRFDTPTVNLYIPFPDYIAFLKNLKQWVYAEFTELPSYKGHPVGLLGGGIRVYFLHYQDFNIAVETWKRRVERIHWDNMFVVLVERDGCTYDNLMEFSSLPFENKVALTHAQYPNIPCSYQIKGYENIEEVGNIMDYAGMFGARVYDQFDWVKFLNKEKL